MPPNAYTISKLATDAGVSVHMIRDYERRGLVCACNSMTGGYRIYDQQALLRLQFIRRGMSIGVPLDVMGELFQSLDNNMVQDTQCFAAKIDQQLKQQVQQVQQFCQLLKQLASTHTVPDCSSPLVQDIN